MVRFGPRFPWTECLLSVAGTDPFKPGWTQEYQLLPPRLFAFGIAVHVWVCMCVHACACACVHTHTHTHTGGFHCYLHLCSGAFEEMRRGTQKVHIGWFFFSTDEFTVLDYTFKKQSIYVLKETGKMKPSNILKIDYAGSIKCTFCFTQGT